MYVLGFLGACYTILAEKYENHTLLRIYPLNESQLEAVYDFNLKNAEKMEILKPSRGLNDSMDVLVPPEQMEMVQNFTRNHELTIMEKKENYLRTLQAPSNETAPRRRAMRLNPAFEYKSYNAILSLLESLAKSNPQLLTIQPLGTSYEGRMLVLAKISANPAARNPIIFVDAGIHAREWVAPSMAVYMIHRLVTDPGAQQDLEGIDWYILPVVNPDGYEFTRSGGANRMWRKTRSKQGNCYGVDGNRNYGFKWAVSGVSLDPCNKETYAGPAAFSEKETQIVKRVMVENSDRIKLYVSLHAYGQYLVYPWGYTGERLPKTWRKLAKLAKVTSEAVVRAGGQPFKVLSAGKWYAAAGGSDDFAFGAIGVPYSYTMELTEGYEFAFPERLLPSVLPKFYEGFRAMGREIRREFPYRRSIF
ncbi:hypothetical protein O0L34_g7790 [Tuta absoluta]|nr:hypothetical protein O0L34_g7790 [Tuta absoluta]